MTVANSAMAGLTWVFGMARVGVAATTVADSIAAAEVPMEWIPSWADWIAKDAPRAGTRAESEVAGFQP